MIGVYIHIPFCNSICSYCDFAKVYYNKKYIDKYLTSLEDEIKLRYKNEVIKSIYIGGGTPSSLDYNELKRLLEITKIFNKDNDIEFTIECNVESVSVDKLKLFKKYGINRLSIGVESFDKDIINILNRSHTKEEAIEKIKLCKKYFDNINIDLMYGITGDINKVKKDIDIFLSLDITHLSIYSLIIEDNTMLKINNYKNIDEDIEYYMYNYIENKLRDYHHYEISNYAKAGYESIHNLNYWNNGNYYGFGLSSVSYLNNYRITNTRNLNKYINGNYLDNKIYEDKKINMDNKIMLGLRKIDGINILDFNNEFDVNIFDIYNIYPLINDGCLKLDNNYLYIDHKYIYLSNEILIKILY